MEDHRSSAGAPAVAAAAACADAWPPCPPASDDGGGGCCSAAAEVDAPLAAGACASGANEDDGAVTASVDSSPTPSLASALLISKAKPCACVLCRGGDAIDARPSCCCSSKTARARVALPAWRLCAHSDHTSAILHTVAPLCCVLILCMPDDFTALARLFEVARGSCSSIELYKGLEQVHRDSRRTHEPRL